MSESVRTLLNDAIDYAGFLPPASGPIRKSLPNYLKAVHEPEGWLVGRLVCPANQLRSLRFRASKLRRLRPRRLATSRQATRLRKKMAEALGVDLERYFDLLAVFDRVGGDSLDLVELVMELEEGLDLDFPNGKAVRNERLKELTASIHEESQHQIRVVRDGVESHREFRKQLDADLRMIASLQRVIIGFAAVDALDLTFPLDTLTGGGSMSAVIEEVVSKTEPLGLSSLFLQLPPLDRWEAGVERALAELEAYSKEQVGLKVFLSATGEDARTADQIAFFIRACQGEGVAWRISTDRSQPLSSVGKQAAAVPGFLNLFTAGVVSWATSLGHEELVSLLGDTTLERFRFAQDGMSWDGNWVANAEIEQWRLRFRNSIDSCQPNEPSIGLRDLLLIA